MIFCLDNSVNVEPTSSCHLWSNWHEDGILQVLSDLILTTVRLETEVQLNSTLWVSSEWQSLEPLRDWTAYPLWCASLSYTRKVTSWTDPFRFLNTLLPEGNKWVSTACLSIWVPGHLILDGEKASENILNFFSCHVHWNFQIENVLQTQRSALSTTFQL